jgi:hypothetical protein
VVLSQHIWSQWVTECLVTVQFHMWGVTDVYFCLWFVNISKCKKEAFHCDRNYHFCSWKCTVVWYTEFSTVESYGRKKSYKKVSQQIYKLVCCCFSLFQINNILTDEQVLKKRFRFKEDTKVTITCSFKRNIRQYWSVFRTMFTGVFKTLILGKQCIKLICKHSQNTALHETKQIYSLCSDSRVL